jgi:hypothetical protein
MCNGLALLFTSAEKSPSTRLRLFDCRDRGIAQDKFFQFIGHTSARLQKPFRGVYALIQGFNEQARSRRRGLCHREVCIDQVGSDNTRSHAVALLIAEAAAPERQMKRTLSLIAASSVTIFRRKSASRAVHDGIRRPQNRW